MRRYLLSLAALLMAAVAFVACSSENEEQELASLARTTWQGQEKADDYTAEPATHTITFNDDTHFCACTSWTQTTRSGGMYDVKVETMGTYTTEGNVCALHHMKRATTTTDLTTDSGMSTTTVSDVDFTTTETFNLKKKTFEYNSIQLAPIAFKHYDWTPAPEENSAQTAVPALYTLQGTWSGKYYVNGQSTQEWADIELDGSKKTCKIAFRKNTQKKPYREVSSTRCTYNGNAIEFTENTGSKWRIEIRVWKQQGETLSEGYIYNDGAAIGTLISLIKQ